jgi:hypothetical protein
MDNWKTKILDTEAAYKQMAFTMQQPIFAGAGVPAGATAPPAAARLSSESITTFGSTTNNSNVYHFTINATNGSAPDIAREVERVLVRRGGVLGEQRSRGMR